MRSAALRAAARPNEPATAKSSREFLFAEAAAGHRPALLESCRAVSQRAAQTLKIAEDNNLPLFTLSLDHLTLGRAALYAAILERSAALRAAATPNDPAATDASGACLPAEAAAGHRPALPAFQHALLELDTAVSGLRHAGEQQYLPLGILTRAWLRFLTNAPPGPDSAQADLDEAWEIAARGPMKLFLAAIHLARARLFGLPMVNSQSPIEGVKYPWDAQPDGSPAPRGPADDLAAAEQLINSSGYHRRDEELADAKHALGVS